MPPMGNAYLKAWSQRYRARLLAELGGVCVQCGTAEDIQFDHKKGRDWKMEATSQWVRLARIKREMQEGKIQLLCGPCNRLKGNPREPN